MEQKVSEPKKISHALLEDIIDQDELIIEELKKMNANLAIVGDALLKMVEGKLKKAVDKK